MQVTETSSPSRAARWALWGLPILVALVSWRFVVLGVELSMPAMLHHAAARELALYAHISFAPVALFLLPFLFNTRLRGRHPAVHRWLGRTYALSVLIAGIAGLSMAREAITGPVAGVGFALLAVVWLAVTAVAVRHAMRRALVAHRRWMIRSAALSFSAVTLRLYMPVLIPILGFDPAYTSIAWLCWIPNLLWAELYLRRRPVLQETA